MLMLRGFTCWFLLMIVGIVSFAQTKRELLFSLPFGKQDTSIGMHLDNLADDEFPGGPKEISVTPDGQRISFVDYVNGCVKVFTYKGELVTRTEGTLANLTCHALAPDGCIYVVYGNNLRRIAKYGPDGKCLSTGVLPREVGVVWELSCTLTGQLCVKTDDANGNLLVFVDDDWSAQRAIIGSHLSSSGKVFAFEPMPNVNWAQSVVAKTQQGRVLATYSLRIDSRQDPTGVGLLFRTFAHTQPTA